MPYLGLDLDRADLLRNELIDWSASVTATRAAVLDACTRADLTCAALVGLDWIAATATGLAADVGRAVARARAFALPPLADAPPDVRARPWNQVRQAASHNTYRHHTIGSVDRLGGHAPELDVHVGAPTRLDDDLVSLNGVAWSDAAELVRDAVSPDEMLRSDWHVYHHSLDPQSTHATLRQALDELAAAPTAGPVTLFLDLKDPLEGDHGPHVLDGVLRDLLGERLFTPADLLARAPDAATLQSAIDRAGWPTVGELDHRVLVVVTDRVEGYRMQPVDRSAAFVAVRPSIAALADPDVVVFNDRGTRVSRAELDAIVERDALLRVWGYPSVAAGVANYVAVD